MSTMKKQGYPQYGVALTCRSFDEYVSMFDLTDEALQAGPVLDVAGGASSFTAEASARGYTAFAADPKYGELPDRLIAAASTEISVSAVKLDSLKRQFDWSYYGSPELHRQGRERSLSLFAGDYRKVFDLHRTYRQLDFVHRRYTPGRLPALPFPDRVFSLILCSHFLFLYDEQLDAAFHESALRELLRLCAPGGEIRIYPVVNLSWRQASSLETALRLCETNGVRAELRSSRLPFIPNSTCYLHISVPAAYSCMNG